MTVLHLTLASPVLSPSRLKLWQAAVSSTVYAATKILPEKIQFIKSNISLQVLAIIKFSLVMY